MTVLFEPVEGFLYSCRKKLCSARKKKPAVNPWITTNHFTFWCQQLNSAESYTNL